MIYIFTHSYPYARRGEVFLSDEMRVVQAMGLAHSVRFVPLCREKGVSASVCPEVLSEPCLLGLADVRSIGRMLRLWIGVLLQPSFWRLPADFNRKLSFGTNLKQGVKYFYAAWAYADWIRRHRHVLKPGDVLYSYWAHYNLLGMVLAKRKGWLPAGVRCISRGHGYDLYEEERGRYFPYREEALSILDGLFPCSDYGAAYMKRHYPAIADRIRPACLGVWSVGTDDEKRMRALRPPLNVCRIVSCASVSSVKRLPLLLDSLAAYSAQMPAGVVLEWHHFGGGKGLSVLQAKASAMTATYPNLKIVWHGQTDNAVLRETYLNMYFHAIVNVSESEGLPVTLMEACAAGIPVVATDVGGSGELVQASGGCLLSGTFTQADFNQTLDAFLQSGEANRQSAYRCFQERFSAERNYTEFWSNHVMAG